MNRQKTLETILVLVLACGVIYWFGHQKHPWLLLVAAILGAVGLFIPALAEKIHWAWMKLAEGMGYIMSKVLLTIIFFVFLLPLSLLSKLFRKKRSQLKSGNNTYFKERNFTYTKESLENVW